jgi:cysteine-rich repeat protein
MADGNAQGARYNVAGMGGGAGVDFWVHGTPVYNYTIAVGGSTFRSNGVAWAVPPTVTDTSAGLVHSALIAGTPVAGLDFARNVELHDDAQIVRVTDTLSNTGAVNLTQVATLDNTDPDQDASGTFYTENDVTTAQVTNDVVTATGPNSDLTVAFGSADSRRVVDASGFENFNPYFILASPQDPNGNAADIGINLAIDYGTLGPGASVSVQWYIVFGATKADALANLGCGNGMLDPGEACDDGNLVPGDGCEPTCTPTGCGNGAVAGAEECDDGNIANGDCCTSGCLFEASGSACVDADGNVCTVNGQCDGAGACVGTPAPLGDPCLDEGNVCTLDQCDGAGACTHPPRPSGVACPDEGNVCTLDQCDGAGACTHPPGPSGVTCPDEGDACTSDECDALGACTHPFAPAGTSCTADGDLCSTGNCDGAGVCDSVAVPQAPCRGPTVSGRGGVLLKPDRITWRWVRGQETQLLDLGQPFTQAGTDYALCIFDASGAAQPLVAARAQAGGLCSPGKLCWAPKGAGIEYSDKVTPDPDGVTLIRLKTGDDGKASVLLRAKDPDLAFGLAVPPLVPPVTVQLKASNGECWGATYSTFKVNDGTKFRANPD